MGEPWWQVANRKRSVQFAAEFRFACPDLKTTTPLLFLAFLLFADSSLVAAEPASTDFRAAFAAAEKRGDKTIVIPAGTYRLGPEPGQKTVWAVHGLHDTEIVADNVTLIATALTRAVAFDECSGVTIHGLTVDYDPLPFTQGTVIAAAPDFGWIDVKLHAGYPRQPYSRIDVVDPATRYRKRGMPFLWGKKAEMQEPDVVRVSRKDIGKAAMVGDLASLSTGPAHDGVPHAITLDRCADMTLRNITLHSAPGMGILESNGEGKATYLGCHVVPGPKPAGASEERLLSTSWDAMQTKTVRVGPHIEDCEIRDAGDDSWSVQSADFLVLKQTGDSLVLASRDEYTRGIEIGDRLTTGLGAPEATIRTRRELSRAEAQLDPATLKKLAEAETWSGWHVSPRCLEVTLDRPLPLKVGDSVYSPDRMGNGFAFVKNRIHSAGRVLIKAGGLIEDNVLDTPHALVVCSELPANAAFGIDGLTIRRNTIRHAGWFCPAPWSSQAGALSITASGAPPNLRPAGSFAHLVIEDNVFEECSGPNVVITSARGVTLRGNRFVRPLHDRPPETGASFHIANNAVVWIAESEDIQLLHNDMIEPGSFASTPVQFAHGVKDVRDSR